MVRRTRPTKHSAPAVNVAPQNSVWFKFARNYPLASPSAGYFYFSTRFAHIWQPLPNRLQKLHSGFYRHGAEQPRRVRNRSTTKAPATAAALKTAQPSAASSNTPRSITSAWMAAAAQPATYFCLGAWTLYNLLKVVSPPPPAPPPPPSLPHPPEPCSLNRSNSATW